MENKTIKKIIRDGDVLNAEEIFRIRHTFPVISWSSYSSFISPYPNAKENWYQTYVKGKKNHSRELTFGKAVADSMLTPKPLAPFTRLGVKPDGTMDEHEFDEMFGKIRIVGSQDTFGRSTNIKVRKHECGEYKTGRLVWTQKRANEHGQLKMYALLHWLKNKIKPEDCIWWLEWCPTYETGDFKIDFVRPIKIHRFYVKITMLDILKFGSEVKKVHKEMTEYVKNHE